MTRITETRGELMKILYYPCIILTGLMGIFNCVHLTKDATEFQPIKVMIRDASRIENMKIRHIFGEIFLQELLARGKDRLDVYDQDSLSVHASANGFVDYYLVFDLMDHQVCDVEKGVAQIMISVKIEKSPDRIIEDSYFEALKGKGIEVICKKVAMRLTERVYKKLVEINRYKVAKPLAEVPDSL